MNNSAKFIAFAGVMGVGKSTLARALAASLSAQMFIEPEADSWPVPDGEKWEDHVANLETWFRETNLSLFQQARLAADNGIASVADGGLFLLVKEFIDHPAAQFYYGMFNDAELSEVRSNGIADWDSAPCPDMLVLLELDIEIWKLFLQKRGREMDANQEFIAGYTDQQALISAAAQKYAAEKKIQFIKFTLTSDDVEQNTQALCALLSAN